PGVVLRRRRWQSGAVTWFARCLDPDTGSEVDVNLTKIGLTAEESRRDWAKRRSDAIRARQAALATGAPLKTETPLASAIEGYLNQIRATRSEGTHAAYEADAEKFIAWTGTRGIQRAHSQDA